jgi:hypothetical protein
MRRWRRLDWSAVYGDDWQVGARNLARYFGKQIGCLLATQRLPVPQDLIDFLDGADRCPSVCFMLYINWRGADAHKMMRRHGFEDGLATFVGLLDAVAFQTRGRLSGVRYGYHIGYVWVIGEWFDAVIGRLGLSIPQSTCRASMDSGGIGSDGGHAGLDRRLSTCGDASVASAPKTDSQLSRE